MTKKMTKDKKFCCKHALKSTKKQK